MAGRLVWAFKQRVCLFIVNTFFKAERQQDGVIAAERVIISYVKKGFFFSLLHGWINKQHQISFARGSDNSFLLPILKLNCSLGNSLPCLDKTVTYLIWNIWKTWGYCCGQHQAAKKQRRTQSDTLTLQLRLPRYSQQILVCHMCWYFYEARRIIVYILVFQWIC